VFYLKYKIYLDEDLSCWNFNYRWSDPSIYYFEIFRLHY